MNKNHKKTASTGKQQQSGSIFGRILHMTGKELKLLKTDKFNLFIALFLLPIAITLYAIMVTQATAAAPVSIAIVSYDSNTYLSFEIPDIDALPQNTTDYYQQQFNIVLGEYFNGTQDYEDIANNESLSNITDIGELKISLFNRYEAALIESINSSEQINLKYFYNGSTNYVGMNQAREQLEKKEIQCILVIPADFSELLLYHLPGLLETIPETSDLLEIQRIINSIQDGIEIFAQTQNMTPHFQIEKTSFFDIPEGYNQDYNYQITKILSFIVFGVSCVLTILVVVQEKAVARLLLTPVKRFEILTAKFLAYSLVLAGQILLIYFTTVWNGLYIVGSLVDLFIAMFLIGFVGIALGMFISTIAKSNQEANQLFFAIFIILVIFSGIFIPIASMPSYLQFIANYLPLAHGDPLIRGIVSRGLSYRGTDFNFLRQQAAILVAATYLFFQRKPYEV